MPDRNRGTSGRFVGAFIVGLAATLVVALLALLPTQVLDLLSASRGEEPPARWQDRPLRVAMVSHPTVHVVDAAGTPRGLEFDLVSGFARTLRREVEVRLFPSVDEARKALARGEVELVAAGTSTHSLGDTEVGTTERYLVSPWLILHSPQKTRPRGFSELDPKRVVISARIVGEPGLDRLRALHPDIEFVPDTAANDELLMAAVGSDDIPYALIEQATHDAARHVHFDAEVGFTVTPALSRGWLFRADSTGLRDQADAFLRRIVVQGQIEVVLDRYFGFPKKVRATDLQVFTERVGSLLPQFRRWFHEAQEQTGIEWRLLAALAYQESHWNADAVSETGVQGFMQLTEDTARRLGVTDRRDPYQSILGGARYLAMIKRDQIPARVEEPDKTFLALAAYNIGPGHLENARILTARMGRNPDRWVDVRRGLVRLARPDEAAQFSLGPCRCLMPIELVESVRSYYDILLRMEAPYRPRLQVRPS